jgi:UDP-N-acetylmuramyl pentapeptide synthase
VVYRREVGELKSAVMDYIRPGDLLLLKGSRMIGLDQILPENVVSNCGAKP